MGEARNAEGKFYFAAGLGRSSDRLKVCCSQRLISGVGERNGGLLNAEGRKWVRLPGTAQIRTPALGLWEQLKFSVTERSDVNLPLL